jgi:indolepyruvate decarboxylase
MTGTELSTIVRLKLNPIIIILNNDGYGTMRKIRAGCFNVITQWDYPKVCELVRGGESTTASTKGEFDTALRRAQQSDNVCVIQLKIPRNETSRQLARIASEVRKRRGMKNSRADSSATPSKGRKLDSQARLASSSFGRRPAR